MKTLLFCTAYIHDAAAWEARYQRWLDHHLGFRLARESTVFLIDDASPWLPEDGGVQVLRELPESLPEGTGPYLRTFSERLGRTGLKSYPGWWRSFLASLEIPRRYGFDKIVHVESDAYLLSEKAISYVDSVHSGWHALWCPRYNIPETAIQVIAADQFDAMQHFADQDVHALGGNFAELMLPFTHVEKRLVGNRYGEFRSRVPSYADFACQVTPGLPLPGK